LSSINQAQDKINEIENLNNDEGEMEILFFLSKNTNQYKQAVVGFDYEQTYDYKGGSSGKELEELALQAAARIDLLTQDALAYITDNARRSDHKTLEVTRAYQHFLGMVVILSLLATGLVALMMGKAPGDYQFR
jgi:hypothetical protein